MFARLNALNLNLLVALDVLLEECSVSQAAARLGCSQPAASNRLAQLRDALDDPLFVRNGQQLVPTPRAEALRGPLRRALAGLDEALAPQAFHPETACGVLRIGSRFEETTFLPALVARLQQEAPRLDVHLRDLRAHDLHQELAAGQVDLVVQPQSQERVYGVMHGREARLHESFYAQRLWEEGWVSVVRQDHPEVDATMSAERYAALDHILISPQGDAFGFVDSALAERDLVRRIALVVPNATMACIHVAQSDHILTTHPGILDSLNLLMHFPLKRVRVPIPIPTAVVSVVWHERTHADPMVRWARRQLVDLTRERREGHAHASRRTQCLPRTRPNGPGAPLR